MDLFHQLISDAFMRYVASFTMFTVILVITLNQIIKNSADRYAPKGFPTIIAFYVSIAFFFFAHSSYARSNLQEIIENQICPVVIPTLKNEVNSLTSKDIKSIVYGCGVDFFEAHSGRRLTEFIPVVNTY